MFRRSFPGTIVLAILLSASTGLSQESTERYIPIGQSPGISGEYSYMGMVNQVDRDSRAVQVEGNEGMMTIKLTDDTEIYLDRSQLKKTNLLGSMDDLRPGQRLEIKFVDYEKKEAADWIKIAVTEDR